MNLITIVSLSFALTAIVIKLLIVKFSHKAPKSKLDYRRNEKISIPLLGGVGILFSVAALCSITQDPILIKLLAASLPLVFLSIVDDYKEIKASYRLLGQILSACIWFYLENINGNFFGTMGLPLALNFAFSLIFVVGMCNAMNLLDGVDGQAGLMSLVILTNLGLNNGHLSVATAVIGGCILGFLYFNKPPAKIYLGETGSSFLGFVIAAMGTVIKPEGSPILGAAALCFIFSLPFCDILSAIVRRRTKKISIWHGDKEHIHHQLLKIGFSKRQVIASTVSVVALSNLFAYYLLNIEKPHSKILLILFATSTLLFVYTLLTSAGKYFAKKISYMSRNLLEKKLAEKHTLFDVTKSKACVIVDLLPYYTDLQGRGILEIESFISDVVNYLSSMEKLNGMHLIGNCSVAVYFSDEKFLNAEKKNICSEIYTILNHFRLVKTLAPVPEGVLFFDSLKNPKLKSILPNLNKIA
jgi:UDP-GlcNAc:undecaprenyl-phosphate GlcNAc-1-phosphate transferase